MAEANAPAPLPADLVKDINDWAVDRFEYYLTKRSPEDQAADDERVNKWKNSDEEKATQMQKIQDAFNAADKNQDGLLNAEEFQAFKVVLIEQANERKSYIDDREGYWEKWFAHACRVNADDPDTMSLQDFFRVMGESIKISMEIHAAHKAKQA